MIEICTIDIELYRVVSPDICTDRVIITEERIAHIKDHHPNDYERFSGYFAEILQVPDYIVEANRPDTASVMKRVTACGKKIQLILRLAASDLEDGYANSVITFLQISERKGIKEYFTDACLARIMMSDIRTL